MGKELLEFISENGGITLEPKSLEPVKFSDGYQVSVLDILTLNTQNMGEQDLWDVLQIARRKAIEHEHDRKNVVYIGLWVDNGLLYVDLSVRIEALSDAVFVAREKQQKAIYSWYDGKSLDVKFIETVERMLKK